MWASPAVEGLRHIMRQVASKPAAARVCCYVLPMCCSCVANVLLGVLPGHGGVAGASALSGFGHSGVSLPGALVGLFCLNSRSLLPLCRSVLPLQ